MAETRQASGHVPTKAVATYSPQERRPSSPRSHGRYPGEHKGEELPHWELETTKKANIFPLIKDAELDLPPRVNSV